MDIIPAMTNWFQMNPDAHLSKFTEIKLKPMEFDKKNYEKTQFEAANIFSQRSPGQKRENYQENEGQGWNQIH